MKRIILFAAIGLSVLLAVVDAGEEGRCDNMEAGDECTYSNENPGICKYESHHCNQGTDCSLVCGSIPAAIKTKISRK